MLKNTFLAALLSVICFLPVSGLAEDEIHTAPVGNSFSDLLSTNNGPESGISSHQSNDCRTNTVFIPVTVYVTQIREVSRIPLQALPEKPSLWRALVPGAGQFQLRENTKGFVLAGFFAVSAACSAGLFLDAYQLRDTSIKGAADAEKILDFKSRHTAMSNAQNLWDRSLQEDGAATALLFAAAAVWAYSVFDYVYSFKHRKALEIGFRDDCLDIRYRTRM